MSSIFIFIFSHCDTTTPTEIIYICVQLFAINFSIPYAIIYSSGCDDKVVRYWHTNGFLIHAQLVFFSRCCWFLFTSVDNESMGTENVVVSDQPTTAMNDVNSFTSHLIREKTTTNFFGTDGQFIVVVDARRSFLGAATADSFERNDT